jgi:uncharacterized protein YbjQ (UPF0145 family)
MTQADILTVYSVQGYQVVAYLGMVFSVADSYNELLQSIVSQATELGANKVIGFRPDIYDNKRFYGSGTAVQLEPI